MNSGFGRNGTDWMAVMIELDRCHCRRGLAYNARGTICSAQPAQSKCFHRGLYERLGVSNRTDHKQRVGCRAANFG